MFKKFNLKTDPALMPEVWAELKGIIILDPDGWDRRNYAVSWRTPITESEFDSRAARSTIRF